MVARALSAPRKSLPSLLMVSRDLTKVLNDQYPKESETQAYLDQLHALNSLSFAKISRSFSLSLSASASSRKVTVSIFPES